MGWIITLAIFGALAYVLLRPTHKPPHTNGYQPPAAPEPPVTLFRDVPAPVAVAAPSGAPITTQKAACELLNGLLASRSAWLRKATAADMRMEMREHVEELRSNIEFLKEEIAKQLEYREAIADELEDEEPTGEPDDEATARTRRHLGHLDREMAEMKAKLAASQQALREFRADRTAWVHAYAQHSLGKGPSPNAAREPLTP